MSKRKKAGFKYPAAVTALFFLAAAQSTLRAAANGGEQGKSNGREALRESRIAIVSFQKAFNKYERTSVVEEQLKKLRDDIERLKSERNRFELRLKELMPKKRENLDEILDLIRSMAKNDLTRERAREEYKQRTLMVTKEIARDIIAMIRQVAKEKGFNIVLNYVEPEDKYLESAMDKFYIEMNRTFPYTDGRDDLTAEIIKRLNMEWERMRLKDK